jgi:transposase
VVSDPDKQSGPRRIEVPLFVALGNGEHVWQCLDRTCGVTIAFLSREAMMQVIIERCAGLDVHQETVVACLLVGTPGLRPTKEVRTFRTMTRELEALRDWLKAAGVTHVGMESTGVYWRPVYAVLEGHFELIVGNARHIRNVPGRKTDVKDSEWIADLVRHGLVAKSFVPPKPLRELRELLRYRRKLVESQAAERNRLLKLLETANVKLASVASDVFGVSGRAMLKALILGTASAEEMAALAKGQLRRKHADLVLALDGKIEDYHRFLLTMQLRRLDAAEQDITALDRRIDEKLEPYRVQHTLLMQIPGVEWLVAAVLIAEIGIDMSQFLSVFHLAAWAGVCPGSSESAGKQRSGRARKGNVHLRTILVGAAISASRTKGSYLKDKFYRLKARRGALRAALAIAHKILVAAYHMLAKGVPYKDLGDAYLDQIGHTRTLANLKRRIERLGYHVVLEPQAVAA